MFGLNPWHGRTEALKKLDLRLFDPDGTAAPVLDKAGIPFKTLRSTDALSAITNGVVILAEGLSLNERKGLARTAEQAVLQRLMDRLRRMTGAFAPVIKLAFT